MVPFLTKFPDDFLGCVKMKNPREKAANEYEKKRPAWSVGQQVSMSVRHFLPISLTAHNLSNLIQN
jgi:hypothetical protein